MRVLMLSKACIVGIYQSKLEAIAREGVDLRVLVPPSWRDERGEQPLERVFTTGYTLKPIPIVFNGNFHAHFYPTLGREIADFKPDIVHIDEEPYNLATWHALWLARRARAKTLFFSWQNILRHYPPPFAWGERWVLDKVDHAIVGTDGAGQVWRDKGYTGAMSVIPQFGSDETLFQPTPRPQRPFTIGFMGRLVEEKGMYTLFDALAGMTGDWHLRLVGGGTLFNALQAHARTLGIAERVTFVGQIPSTQMPHEYAQLDALVLPSLTRPNWKEQFGRVLVEAMLCGVPVVGSDSGAIPDVVADAGIITPEGDTHALHKALITLQEDATLRQMWGEKGRAHALAHYTQTRIAQKTVALYRALYEG